MGKNYKFPLSTWRFILCAPGLVVVTSAAGEKNYANKPPRRKLRYWFQCDPEHRAGSSCTGSRQARLACSVTVSEQTEDDCYHYEMPCAGKDNRLITLAAAVGIHQLEQREKSSSSLTRRSCTGPRLHGLNWPFSKQTNGQTDIQTLGNGQRSRQENGPELSCH